MAHCADHRDSQHPHQKAATISSEGGGKLLHRRLASVSPLENTIDRLNDCQRESDANSDSGFRMRPGRECLRLTLNVPEPDILILNLRAIA